MIVDTCEGFRDDKPTTACILTSLGDCNVEGFASSLPTAISYKYLTEHHWLD